MLEVVLYLLLLALVILFVFYLYVDTRRKNLIAAEKQAISARASKMKYNFKEELKKLVEQEMLTIPENNSIFRIANNFFVFQKLSASSVTYGEQLLQNIISAISMKKPEDKNSGEVKDTDQTKEPINTFIQSLPPAANGYSARFYRNDLPLLIDQLITSQSNVTEQENSEINAPLPEVAA